MVCQLSVDSIKIYFNTNLHTDFFLSKRFELYFLIDVFLLCFRFRLFEFRQRVNNFFFIFPLASTLTYFHFVFFFSFKHRKCHYSLDFVRWELVIVTLFSLPNATFLSTQFTQQQQQNTFRPFFTFSFLRFV